MTRKSIGDSFLPIPIRPRKALLSTLPPSLIAASAAIILLWPHNYFDTMKFET